MRVSARIARVLFEGVEAVGLRRESLVEGLRLDLAVLSSPRHEIEWRTAVALLDRMAALLDHDVGRIREVGRALVRAPSWPFLRALARTAVSPHRLYEVGTRWLAPATFPHLALAVEVVSPDRLRFQGSIPAPHAPCEPFFHIFEGVLEEVPVLLGMPRATLVSSRVAARTIDVVVDVPRSRSVLDRARRAARAARAALHPGEELALLERQRVELEQAVAGLQRAYGETHALFDVLPEVILIHQKGEVLWANRAAVRTLGYASLDELVGRSLSALLDAASRGVMRERMQRVLEGEPIPELTEARLRTRSGASVLLELFPSQGVSFHGESARLLFGRDITERERLEQKLRAADRMASIGMLAAGVAHEVNNPLGYVLNNVEMAVRELGPLGEGAKRSRAALGVALEGVDRIRVIVRDLLELARVDDRAVGPVDVRRVVESTLALAGQKIAERATLQADYEPVPLARGTASRLGQVVLNLVSNALEAMPAETPAANRLGVSVRRSPDGGALLEVRDSGVGISAENAARVLDPFFTTKEAGSGTGLGLAISQRLVAEMGGTLTFESAPGQGSAFRVTLPPAEAAPLRAVEAPAPGAATPAPS